MQVNHNNVRFFRVETATDALRRMDNIEQVYVYMAEHGYKLYYFSEPDQLGDVYVSVPELADQRKAYREAKAKWCDRYGCE